MANKLKFKIENKNVILIDDASKDDFIPLDDILSFNQNKFISDDAKQNIINEFKANDNEYKSLIKISVENKKNNEEIERLNKLLIEQKEKYENDKQKEIDVEVKLKLNEEKQKNENEINKLNEKINDLKVKNAELFTTINSQEEVINLKVKSKLNEEKQKNENEIKKLNEEINNLKIKNAELSTIINSQEEVIDLKVKDIIKEKQDEWNKEKNDLIENYNKKIDEMKNIRDKKNIMNTKLFGEEFENWCVNEYKKQTENTIFDCEFEKAPKIENKKADFIFTVYDREKSKSRNELCKVVLEMKAQTLDGKEENKKSNQHYINKLKNDVLNNKGSIGLLVSELEPNDEFIFKKYPDAECELYVVRPHAFVSLLMVIRKLTLMHKNIITNELNFKEKNDILDNFEKLKKTILESKDREKLSKEIKKISDSTETIIEKAENIKEIISTKIEKHFDKVIKMLEDFEIKLPKKILNELP